MSLSTVTKLEIARQTVVNDSYLENSSSSPIRFRNDANTSRSLIRRALKQRVDSIDHNTCEAGNEDPFFVADLGEVYRQHMRWKLNLPRIRPFYAVKCNPDPEVIRLLSKLGAGFDCASKAEIEQVLKFDVDPTRIIYAQPCKTNSYIRYAANRGVKKMTFDNMDELHKIKKLSPQAELFLRICADDSSSLCRLSLKFGAAMDSTIQLLDLARKLDLNVTGISFHVGSAASDPLAFRRAVQDAHTVFEQAVARGFHLRTIDIGGGFTSENFEPMAATLSQALDEFIPSYVNIIAEPGRYYVASAFTLASHVIARRTIEDPETRRKSYMLYLNDGLYGNFSSIMFDHQHPKAKIFRANGLICFDEASSQESNNGYAYSLWGPTCDGIDCITEKVRFDKVLDVGDWFYFENMGAYTKCSATRFNGFTNSHDTIYIMSEPGVKSLLVKD